jgi:hypothetical protein
MDKFKHVKQIINLKPCNKLIKISPIPPFSHKNKKMSVIKIFSFLKLNQIFLIKRLIFLKNQNLIKN